MKPGNVWHLPNSAEIRGTGGMRHPAGPLPPETEVTFFTGNQFRGGPDEGDQQEKGSLLFWRPDTEAEWRPVPMRFFREVGNNKYYRASIQLSSFPEETRNVQYYFDIPYANRLRTFVHQGNGTSSAVTTDEDAAQAAPFAFALADPAQTGAWSPVFALPNVAIHASVLPSGRVLMWGRRDTPDGDLDQHFCSPFVWDPATGKDRSTSRPTAQDGVTPVNLFCAGHTFLPDGKLLVVGGHWKDSQGIDQATVFREADEGTDAAGEWTPLPPMNRGRWYPTAITLPNGHALVMAGSYAEGGGIVHNTVAQIWDGAAWREGVPRFPEGEQGILPLYPSLHVVSSGGVFLSGPLGGTYRLDPAPTGGGWTPTGTRAMAFRDYCPAVQYAADQILFIGGGQDQGSRVPTAEVETIDLSAAAPRWEKTDPLNIPRRHHNACVLPDGSVLVTGGTRGGGGPSNGFNDMEAGQPVHSPEVWDPRTGKWTLLAAEAVDRCYHATAVLLPDGRVLSAGGGEYRPDNQNPNPPEDSHRSAQVFSPPYLFRGPRPQIVSAPDAIDYGAVFEVVTPQAKQIARATLIRLPSVTHSQDMNQHVAVLACEVAANGGGDRLRVTAPASPAACPPGHYMLFLIDRAGIPSVAKIVLVRQTAAPAAAAATRRRTPIRLTTADAADTAAPAAVRLADQQREWDAAVAASAGPLVRVGVTGSCPYGIGACWAGAYVALGQLEGVERVKPFPDVERSTAELLLRDGAVPARDVWERQFHTLVNGTYTLRDIEVLPSAGGGAPLSEPGRE